MKLSSLFEVSNQFGMYDDPLDGMDSSNSETPNDKITGMLSDEELKIAYDKLLQHELSKDAINKLAQSLVAQGEYVRSPESAKFLLSRMHILLHGIAPEGETPNRAATMFAIPQSMYNFVVRQGDLDEEDLYYHVEQAKEELANRKIPKKVDKQTALKIMAQYYREHKATISKNIVQYRDQIVQDIMNGLSPEEAFGRVA